MMQVPYQALVLEGVINAAKKQPEGPQIFESEVNHEIGDEHKGPYKKELHVDESVAVEDREQC